MQNRKESHTKKNHNTRVAFFPDSYLEVNGVARTSRQFTTFAEDHNIPFLCIYGGGETKQIECGNLTKLSLKKTRVGFKYEADQRFDFLMWRHVNLVMNTVREFKADVIHITGPSDIGQLGAYVAWKLKLPLVASWHTNLHEYLGLRIKNSVRLLPSTARTFAAKFAEDNSLRAIQKFYKGAKVLLAPNQELCDMLEECSGKQAFTMARGIDTTMFTPAKRFRRDSTFTIGYVGRITPEKNVALLEHIEKELIRTGNNNFRFRIIGTGSELERLKRTMSRAEFPGVLEGEELSRAYADFDLFVFPSETDTFGNVVLEAQASGVPCIVSGRGGPKFIIKDGITGIVVNDKSEFLNAILLLMNNQNKLNSMREASRKLALESSWNSIFNQVYQAYEHGLETKSIKSLTQRHGETEVQSFLFHK